MIGNRFRQALAKILGLNTKKIPRGNYISLADNACKEAQSQTNNAFSDKWNRYGKSAEKKRWYEMQKRWYLELYGFGSEKKLADFLKKRKVIFDAGCGMGYKAAWFARLAPESLVIGMDLSYAIKHAAKAYSGLANLFFIKGDIARTPFPDAGIDYTNCDQVIMHTRNPEKTFAEMVRITSKDGGEIACYFYAKKALPRELLDEYFRAQCVRMNRGELWKMSEQLAELGKRLARLNVNFDAPDIPALGIKGGRYDIQRFIYWNFIKCFWNEELGKETSVVTNYDWYSPNLAKRYGKKEIENLIERNSLLTAHFHQEEACYSGRFIR